MEKYSLGFGKKKFWLQYRYRNWTSVSVPDTKLVSVVHYQKPSKNNLYLFNFEKYQEIAQKYGTLLGVACQNLINMMK